MWLWCVETEVLSFTHPINLHHRDDTCYLAMATILLHNMMVEEHMPNGEVEDTSCHNKICSDNYDNSAEEVNLDNDGYDKSPAGRH